MEIKVNEEMRREIVEQATGQLLRQLMAEFNVRQIAAEVKNAVIQKAAKDLSQRFGATYQLNEVVDKAVKSAESRVQQKVTELLAKGVTIKFTE